MRNRSDHRGFFAFADIPPLRAFEQLCAEEAGLLWFGTRSIVGGCRWQAQLRHDLLQFAKVLFRGRTSVLAQPAEISTQKKRATFKSNAARSSCLLETIR
ncbi:MAG TPA: hypothetical protein VFW94_05755 [Candidatus Acidoferrales bacterium]|nr:hypothetical protein [Candidatus Acidoferrales bacterium]